MSKFVDMVDVFFVQNKKEAKNINKKTIPKKKVFGRKILDTSFYAMNSDCVDYESFIEKRKDKDIKYETFIAKHYRRLGYTVWEHGRDKGELDRGIDLIIKKRREIFFIQCKNWDKNLSFLIDDTEMKRLKTEAEQFLEENPLFKKYKIKFRYTLSNNCIDPSTLHYIDKNKEFLEYEIVMM